MAALVALPNMDNLRAKLVVEGFVDEFPLVVAGLLFDNCLENMCVHGLLLPRERGCFSEFGIVVFHGFQYGSVLLRASKTTAILHQQNSITSPLKKLMR